MVELHQRIVYLTTCRCSHKVREILHSVVEHIHYKARVVIYGQSVLARLRVYTHRTLCVEQHAQRIPRNTLENKAHRCGCCHQSTPPVNACQRLYDTRSTAIAHVVALGISNSRTTLSANGNHIALSIRHTDNRTALSERGLPAHLLIANVNRLYGYLKVARRVLHDQLCQFPML